MHIWFLIHFYYAAVDNVVIICRSSLFFSYLETASRYIMQGEGEVITVLFLKGHDKGQDHIIIQHVGIINTNIKIYCKIINKIVLDKQ